MATGKKAVCNKICTKKVLSVADVNLIQVKGVKKYQNSAIDQHSLQALN